MSHDLDRYPTVLKPADVAALFRVGPKTVGRWADEGRLRSIRTPGGHRRFFADNVYACLTWPRDDAANRADQ
jgi:excisionase family DNA binding protein